MTKELVILAEELSTTASETNFYDFINTEMIEEIKEEEREWGLTIMLLSIVIGVSMIIASPFFIVKSSFVELLWILTIFLFLYISFCSSVFGSILLQKKHPFLKKYENLKTKFEKEKLLTNIEKLKNKYTNKEEA